MRTLALALSILAVAPLAGCASSAPGARRASLYPDRPTSEHTVPLADPPLQRPTLHLTLTREGLAALLDASVPRDDTGAFTLLGARAWRWQRQPFALAFDDAKKTIAFTSAVSVTVELPGTTLVIPMQVRAVAQPVLTAQHRLVLQTVDVDVTSDDRRMRLADVTAGVVARFEALLTERLTGLAVDLRPSLQALADRLAAPLFLPLQPASACFTLDVRGLEAGPAILADGFEKQLALTIAPSLTMPCTRRGADGGLVVVDEAAPPLAESAPLPPLQNASSIEGGPFALQVPIAAGYDELQRAMTLAFPDGKLSFSTEQPHLYLTTPEVFASGGDVVVRVRLAGYVEQGVRVDVDGDLYLQGRPAVRDNFLEFPDLRPTMETDQALLKLALALKQQELVAAVQRALRLDLSARLADVKRHLEEALSVRVVVAEGVGPLCTKASLGRLSVDDIAVHDPYLRAVVSTTALLSASLPCPGEPAVVPVAAVVPAAAAATASPKAAPDPATTVHAVPSTNATSATNTTEP